MCNGSSLKANVAVSLDVSHLHIGELDKLD